MAKNKQCRSQIYDLVTLVLKKTKKEQFMNLGVKRVPHPNPIDNKFLMFSDEEKRRRRRKKNK